MKTLSLPSIMDRPRKLRVWHAEEEEYLQSLAKHCEVLSIHYNEIYNDYKQKEVKFKIPVIVTGSFVGMLSFGSSQFSELQTKLISIGVGCTSILISIISSIEAYLQIGQIMSGSLLAATTFKKIKEKIDVELALPVEDRNQSGVLMARQCNAEYVDMIEIAPSVDFKKILSHPPPFIVSPIVSIR